MKSEPKKVYANGVEDGFDQLSKEVAAKIARCSPQLFLIDDGFPMPLASSILVAVDHRYFLVTAKHVLENTIRGEIKICLNHNCIAIRGQWYYPEIPKADITFTELHPEDHSIFTEYFEFYSLNNFDPDHRIERNQNFFVFGYPCSKTKPVNKTKRIKTEAYSTYTRLKDQKNCFQMGLHPNTHLVLELNNHSLKASGSNKNIKYPDQHGMSGGGIWILDDEGEIDLTNIQLILSGIYIEFHKNRDAIIATRTLILTEILRMHFGINLPQTKLLKVGET